MDPATKASGITVKSDADIVQAAQRGDRQAAADLIDRHAAAVYAACLAQTADPDAAQDIAQDALLKAMDKLGTLRDGRVFKSWLMAIARNLCRDAWKQRSRRQELLAQEVPVALAADGSVPVPGLGRGPAQALDPEYFDLHAALCRLPEKFRLPLFLYYFDGQSTARVAEALDVSLTGACTRLCRARQALRKILEGNHE